MNRRSAAPTWTRSVATRLAPKRGERRRDHRRTKTDSRRLGPFDRLTSALREGKWQYSTSCCAKESRRSAMKMVRPLAIALSFSFLLSGLLAGGPIGPSTADRTRTASPGKGRHPVERRRPQGRLAKADQHGLQFLRRQRRQGLHAGRARNQRQVAGNLPGPGCGNRQGALVRRYRQGRRLRRRRYGRRRRRSAVHAYRERRQGLSAHARSGRPLPRCTTRASRSGNAI